MMGLAHVPLASCVWVGDYMKKPLGRIGNEG
jgi:hypothetical protein